MIRFSDLRAAWRTLTRAPGFSIVAILTLAAGIGANTAVFTVVRGVLLRPLPYRDAGRLMVVWEDLIREENHRFSVANPNFQDLAARARSFESLAAQLGSGGSLTGGGAPESVLAAQVTGNFFGVLGAAAALGRTIGVEDQRNGPARVAVLRNSLWKRRFGGDRAIVGRKIVMDGTPFTVVGVMPEGFEVPSQLKAPQTVTEVWTPLDLPSRWNSRSVAVLQVVGRLKPGFSVSSADAEVRAIAANLAREYPDSNANVGMHVVPLRTQMFGDVRPALLVLSGAVGLVLLVACANLAHLLLVRASSRRRDIAVRVALGASRGRVVGTLLAESFLLAAAGGVLGYALASFSTSALVRIAPGQVPRLSEVRPDLAVLAFAFLVSLGSALVSGLLPALRAASEPPEPALRGEGLASARGSGRLRAGLVVSQIALALLLFSGAALLLRTFERLRRFDVGFATDNVLTVRLLLPRTGYGTPAAQLAFFDRLFPRIAAIPGVTAAGGTSRLPLDPAYGVGSITFEGRDARGEAAPVVGARVVGGDYFRAMGIPVERGRAFDVSDRPGSSPTVLVNRTMASRFWPGESPIGKRIAIGQPADAWLTVVGIVGDVSHDGIDAAPLPEVYMPFRQNPGSGLNLVVRAAGGFAALPAALRREVAVLDPELALVEMRPMSARVDDALAQPRFLVQTLGFLGTLALLLASLAVFALVSHDALRRRREIGIRMAIGASSADVLRLFLGNAARLLAAGLAIGLAAALALGRLLRPALHGTPADDPASLGAAAVLLTVVALAAAAIPAWRALRSDPLESLRND